MELRLAALHRLLIRASVALGALLAVYGLARYLRAHDGRSLVTGIVGAVACGLLALYLRWFARKQSTRPLP